MHLGWDVVSVAAGGGGTPIRPVQVEGTYTPPAYLLADASGRLHTAGVDRRPDVGIAISDVRDIIGHPQIVVAGATWPAELVFRARMHNSLSAITKHLGTQADVVALPFPDEWPDPKVDEFARLVEQLGVVAEPLPESVALSGYVRALGIVRAAGRGPAVGATGVYSDGRECLVVAVHGDDDQPTESVSVAITDAALHDARAADNVVIEVMAAARAINADTSTVLLTGNVCFNDALRLAFQNHLGHRFQVADHPMHAVVLGATHLLVSDSEGEELPDPTPLQHAPAPGQGSAPAPVQGSAPGAGSTHAQQSSRGEAAGHGESAEQSSAQAARSGAAAGPVAGQGGPNAAAAAAAAGAAAAGQVQAGAHADIDADVALDQTRRITRDAPPAAASAAPASAGAGTPVEFEQTQRVSPEEMAAAPVASRGGLPPGLAGVGGRFTRPPGTPADDRSTTVMGRSESGAEGASAGGYGSAATQSATAGSSAAAYGQQGGAPQAVPGSQPGSQGANAGGYAAQGPGTGGYPVQGHGAVGYPAQGPVTGGPHGAQGSPYGSQGGSYGAASGPYGSGASGGYGAQGGYGQGGYGGQGGAPGSGAPQGGQPGGYGSPAPGQQGGFGPHSGNAPGQAGSGYGGSMPSAGSRHSGSQTPEDAAGQPDSESGDERKPRKGKLWNKVKNNLRGAPIVVGAATLAAVGMHAEAEPAHSAAPEAGALDTVVSAQAAREAAPIADASRDTATFGPATFDIASTAAVHAAAVTAFGAWPSLERNAVEVHDSCVLTPPAAALPHPGIAPVNTQDCLRLGIDTLRYSIPGPVRGIDPGPPTQI